MNPSFENLGLRWRQMRFNPLRSLTPERLASALDQAAAGWLREQALICEVIEQREAVVRSVMTKRRAAVARRDWNVIIPDADDARGEAHKATLEYFYNNLTVTDATDLNVRTGVSGLLRQMMDAIIQRYAVHEIVWKPGAEGLTAELRRVPLYFFENRSGKLRFVGPENRADGTDLEEDGWMVTVADGLGEALAICYMYKRMGVQDLLAYSEKFSIPGVLGRTSAKKGSPEGDAMRDSVMAYASEWVGLVYGDDGSVKDPIQVIQTPSGASLPQMTIAEYMDRMIATLVRGGDLSTVSRKDSTGANSQEDEQAALLEDDCALVSETLQTQLDRMVIKMVHGDETPAAYIVINPPDTTDFARELAVDEGLARLGVKQKPEDLAEKYGREHDEVEAEKLKTETLKEEEEVNRKAAKAAKGREGEEEEIAAENYDQNQLRDPAGTSSGGRWTKAGGGGSKSQRAERGPMRPATDEDRKRLKVPPAYTDLMVSDDTDADLLGLAKKPDGSDFPVYSEAYNDANTDAKWRRIVDLDGEFDSLSAQMDADIAAGGADAGPAAALRLIRQTGMRNGGDGESFVNILGEDGEPLRAFTVPAVSGTMSGDAAMVDENLLQKPGKNLKTQIDTYGASNLRGSHVSVDGDKVSLNFPGKKGVAQAMTISDPVLARHLAPIAGQDVKAFATTDAKTLKYLGKISGDKYKVHDFRSLHATLTAEDAVNAAGGQRFAAGSKELKKFQLEIAKPVAEALGNTPAVALENYIHPAVFAGVIQ